MKDKYNKVETLDNSAPELLKAILQHNPHAFDEAKRLQAQAQLAACSVRTKWIFLPKLTTIFLCKFRRLALELRIAICKASLRLKRRRRLFRMHRRRSKITKFRKIYAIYFGKKRLSRSKR